MEIQVDCYNVNRMRSILSPMIIEIGDMVRIASDCLDEQLKDRELLVIAHNVETGNKVIADFTGYRIREVIARFVNEPKWAEYTISKITTRRGGLVGPVTIEVLERESLDRLTRDVIEIIEESEKDASHLLSRI